MPLHSSEVSSRGRPSRTPPSRPLTEKVASSTLQKTYDRESGQVYIETEHPVPKKSSFNWIHEYKTLRPTTRRRPNDRGSRSLFDTVTFKCARQARDFAPEHLKFVPWSVMEKVWQEVLKTQTESFHIWRTMATTYAQEFASKDNRYILDIKSPALPLTEYFEGVTSPANRWEVTLRISPKQIATTDLMNVMKITNLSILDLSDRQPYAESRASTLTERVFRAWAEMAAAGRAFRHLRVLLLGWQEHVEPWIFQYLQHFPRLACVILTDCRLLHQKNRSLWESDATDRGWDALHAKKSVKMLRPWLDGQDSDFARSSNLAYCDDTFYIDEQTSTRSVPPMLELSMGSPRSWNHILDEFPGTRTIWLQRIRSDSSSPRQKPAGTNQTVEESNVLKREREDEVPSPRSESTSASVVNRRPAEGKLSRDARDPTRSRRKFKAPLRATSDMLTDLGLRSR